MGMYPYGILAYGLDFGEELPSFARKWAEEYDYFDMNKFLWAENGWDREDISYPQRMKLLETTPVEYTDYGYCDYPKHIFAVRGNGSSS